MPSSAHFLLRHFDRLAEAPGGIAKLRELVLRLAMDGKLLPAQRATTDSTEEWPKRPLGSIASLITKGSTPTSYGHPYESTGIPFVKVENINDGVIQHSLIGQFISIAAHDFLKRSQLESGDVLFSIAGTIGKTCIVEPNDVPANTNQALAIIRGVGTCFEPAFLKLQLDSFVANEVREKARGGAMPNVSLGDLRDLVVVIPPLAEQRRIVAKVEELMGLCDALEAAQQEREIVRTRLRTSALHQLASPDSDSKSAAFVLKHLPLLTPASEDLLVVRRLVLDFAISGKLTEQRTSEEHASKLHARLLTDIKAHADRSGISEHTSAIVPDDKAPWPSPKGWVWTRLSGLFHVITDGDHQPPPKADDGIAFLTIGNITTGSLDFSDCRFVPKKYWDALPPHRRPSHGDILYTVVGATYGRPALVETKREFCVQRHVAILKPAKETDSKFLMLFLASRFAYDQATRSITGTAQPTVPLRPLRNFLMPLPPLAEQRRIVAKVDELMAVLDALEATLTTARTTAESLLTATIARLSAA